MLYDTIKQYTHVRAYYKFNAPIIRNLLCVLFGLAEESVYERVGMVLLKWYVVSKHIKKATLAPKS